MTTWQGRGGTPQPPVGYRPPGQPDVAAGSPTILRARLVLVSGTGGGLFVYTGTPKLGNPPIFWATSASTDPFGNVVTPTAGVAGTGRFSAGNTIINANGVFIYSGTPSSSNLILSLCPTATTDPFGTATKQGFATYTTTQPALAAIGLNADNHYALFFQDTSSVPFTGPNIFSGQANASGTSITVDSGLAVSRPTDADANIVVASQLASGITGGRITFTAGRVLLDSAGLAFWDDNAGSLALPAAGGPFISGESFHALTTPAGITGNLSGGVSLRVKKLPWNAVWIDFDFNVTTTGTSFTWGSNFPDATYYPNVTRHFPTSSNGTPAGRIFVPTSGAPQFLCSSGVANVNYGGSFMYPTN